MQRLEFNEWMSKINNIYYANAERMANANNIIMENEEIGAILSTFEKFSKHARGKVYC